MGIVLKVVHADNSVGTIELGSDSKVVFKQGDRVDVSKINNLKDVEVDKDGNVVLTFPDGKVVLSNLPKEQLDALMAQLPPDEVSTASTPASGKAMTGLLLLSLQSMLKTGGGLEFNSSQSLSGNAVKLDFGAPQTSSDTKASSFASLAPSGISLSASFVSVINGKEEATSVEDTITAIKASLTVTNPVQKDVTFVEQSAVKGDYGAFSISKSGDWTYQLNDASQKVQALSAGETVTDTFTVVSSDGSAARDVRVVIAGTNDAPMLAAGRISTTENAASASLDLAKLASDIDSDDDPSTLRYSIVGQPDQGIASINGTELTFSPGSDFAGLHAGEALTETIKVRVTDSHGASADNVVTVTVSGVADAPVLRSGHFSLGEDDTDSIALSSFVVASGTSNRAIDFAITSQPVAGSASIVNGQLVFTPGAALQSLEFGETREIEIGLRGTNSAGISTETTVQYKVIGSADKPIPSVVTVTVNEDSGPVSIDLMSIVSDRSHNPDLNFIRTSNNGDGELSLSIDPATEGVLTFDPNGEFNSLTAGQSSTVVANFQISDALQNRINLPVNIIVTGANEVPVVIDGHLDAVEDGATVAMKLMSLVKTTGLDDGALPTFAIVEQPEKGLASISNGQLVFNPAKGFDDLAKGESRDVDVTVRVTNSQGETADATVTVTVSGINDAPTISDKTLNITESATATIDLASLAGDVDSDDSAETLNYVITGEPKLGNATLKGTTLSFETNSEFESLSKGETRSVEIDLSATDRHGQSGKGTVTITVTGENDAPILSAARLSAAEDGASVALDLAKLASDIDSDDDGKTLTYSIIKGPLEGTAKLSGTSLIFDPGQGFQSLEEGETRDVTVVVRATDSHGASADATIAVTVTGRYDGETVLLSDIAAGEGGFRIVGERAGDMAGLSVSSAGDFNGDGFDDFIIGAPGNDAIGSPRDLPETLLDHGAVYFVYGTQQRPNEINLDEIAAGRGGFKIIPGVTTLGGAAGIPGPRC